MTNFFQNVLPMPIHEGFWLKRKLRDSGIRQEDFAETLGVSRNTLQILMRDTDLSPKYRQAILGHLSITEEELEKAGEGAKEPELPYATYKENRTDYNVSNQVSRSKPNMWLVPIKAQAGFAKRFDDPVFRNQMQRVAFPMVMGECFGFEVEGKSMQPKYDPFSWVVCTLIDDYTWLRKGKNYVFQTYEGIYIKQFDQIEANVIRMVSINPDYNPVEGLPLNETRKLYAIEGKYVKE